jgi:hypothetical protein
MRRSNPSVNTIAASSPRRHRPEPATARQISRPVVLVHPAGRAVEVDQASGCASGGRTASRSSCAHVVTAQAFGAGQRSGNVSCMLMDVARDLARWLLRTAPRLEWAYIAVELNLRDTEESCPRALCRSFRVAFRPGSGRRRWSDHIESRCARRYHPLALTYRSPEYVAQCPSPRLASSASEPPRKQYRPRAAPA